MSQQIGYHNSTLIASAGITIYPSELSLWSNKSDGKNDTLAHIHKVEEGVLLRNVSAAPICDHFAVLPPSSRIREAVLSWCDHSGFEGGGG